MYKWYQIVQNVSYFSKGRHETPAINLTAVDVPIEMKITYGLTTLFQLELITKSL